MIDEREFVLKSFKKNFGKYIGKPLVIYGLGKNTKAVLDELDEFYIMGLMDEVRAGETVFGKKVISCKEAAEWQAAAIIIIARASNVPIIYKRIAMFCEKNEIPVYDINGTKQTIHGEAWQGLPNIYDEMKEEKLRNLIKKSDVVSFDIFDTLLMRKVLYPMDIFLMLEETLKEKYGIGRMDGFAEKRVRSEQDLYLEMQPNLHDIYYRLNKEYKVDEHTLNAWMEEEIKKEEENLTAREAMLSIFRYALDCGKEICFTSDMYLSSKTLRRFLLKNGYPADDIPIFVSNEEGAAKCNGLFEKLRHKYGNQKILHVGDHEEVDQKNALLMGINEVFLIRSASDMLKDSSAKKLLQFTDDISNRKLIAEFIAMQFNNPFIFEKTKGKLCITSEYEIGYSFLAPIVTVFMKWLLEKTAELNITKILLSSRDGYLIKQLLDIMQSKSRQEPLLEYSYFYASRNVCLRAGLRDEQDIEYVAYLPFSGTVDEMIMKRFGLDQLELLSHLEGETQTEYVLRHKEQILHYTEILRKNYITYIQSQGLDLKGKYGFFDFVSSGTCQMAVEQFMDWKLTGLYFTKIYDTKKENLHIEALCPETYVYAEELAIMKKYFFMENVFTSFESTLEGFDQNGQPIFAKEYRTEEQLHSLWLIQKGIKDAFGHFLSPTGEIQLDNLQLADLFVRYIGNEYMLQDLDYFKDNPLVDEFCNRSFNLSEI